MDPMIERWKHALDACDESVKKDRQIHSSHEKTCSLKKSIEKSKKSLHVNENKQSVKKVITPSKSKRKSKKFSALEEAVESIIDCVGKSLSEKVQAKIRTIIQRVWESAGHQNIENQIEFKQSTVSTAKNRYQEKLYHDLERKFYECEKERYYYKGKCEALVKKYETTERQLQRFSKIEKLIDASIEREQSMGIEITRLRKQLDIAEKKLVQQQKIFQKQVLIIHQLVQSIKGSLPDK